MKKKLICFYFLAVFGCLGIYSSGALASVDPHWADPSDGGSGRASPVRPIPSHVREEDRSGAGSGEVVSAGAGAGGGFGAARLATDAFNIFTFGRTDSINNDPIDFPITHMDSTCTGDVLTSLNFRKNDGTTLFCGGKFGNLTSNGVTVASDGTFTIKGITATSRTITSITGETGGNSFEMGFSSLGEEILKSTDTAKVPDPFTCKINCIYHDLAFRDPADGSISSGDVNNGFGAIRGIQFLYTPASGNDDIPSPPKPFTSNLPSWYGQSLSFGNKLAIPYPQSLNMASASGARATFSWRTGDFIDALIFVKEGVTYTAGDSGGGRECDSSMSFASDGSVFITKIGHLDQTTGMGSTHDHLSLLEGCLGGYFDDSWGINSDNSFSIKCGDGGTLCWPVDSHTPFQGVFETIYYFPDGGQGPCTAGVSGIDFKVMTMKST